MSIGPSYVVLAAVAAPIAAAAAAAAAAVTTASRSLVSLHRRRRFLRCAPSPPPPAVPLLPAARRRSPRPPLSGPTFPFATLQPPRRPAPPRPGTPKPPLPRTTAAFLLRRDDLHLPPAPPACRSSRSFPLVARPCPRYYHSVLLAIYRPLSTVPPVNERRRRRRGCRRRWPRPPIPRFPGNRGGTRIRRESSIRRTLVNQRGWLIVS